MPAYHSETDPSAEPKRRFYPPQGMQPQNPRSMHPLSSALPSSPPALCPGPRTPAPRQRDDAAYLAHRHPILLQRLYNATDILINTYREQDFIYDASPDYLSLRLMRDRLLRENSGLTKEFLQSGCPIAWLQLLTDVVISEVLCRRRCSHRNPMGEARTTSVQSSVRS